MMQTISSGSSRRKRADSTPRLTPSHFTANSSCPLVDAGLTDLAAGETTPESLTVSLAAPRLRREGVPVSAVLDDPERRLFDLLSRTEGDLAHARYNAYLRRVVSFADACRLARVDRKHRAT